MATIQPKVKSTIQKGINFTYSPSTFAEHIVPQFIETDNPDEILKGIEPLEFCGMRLIFFDTETYPYYKLSSDVPVGIVRRWVGTGKKANPQDYPFCITVCDGKKAYVLYDTKENNWAKFKALAPLFEDRSIDKCAHNIKFDMHMIQNIGMKIVGRLHDTVVISKLANENRMSFKLVDLAKKIPGGMIKFEYMVDAYKKQYKIGDYRGIPRELMTQYTCADTWNDMLLFVNEYVKLIQDELVPLYDNEMKNTVALYAMERHGCPVDREYEPEVKAELFNKMNASERDVYDTVGRMFNMNSGKQLYEVLMQMGVDPKWIATSDKGNPVLDKYALENLANKGVDIVKKILEYRQSEKMYTTYAVGIYDQADSRNKVHGSINQTEAITGRMSIVKPALQTLPKKDKRIRRCFIPSYGFNLFFSDLDQVEYRMFAHYAQATALMELIKQGYDVHTATASLLFNVPYNDVTEEQRSRAKTMNFALIYGMGKDALAAALGMSLAEAEAFKEKYFAAIPEARPFINEVQRISKGRGFVRNYYKRRRRLEYDEAYKACNALIQGCAADYLKHKIAMIYAYLRSNAYKTRMTLVVHDELKYENHVDELHIMPKLRWLMSDFETFRVPITAGMEQGNPSWGQKAETEIGFEPLTEAELEAVYAFDYFDGHVFDNELYAA